MLNKIDKIWYYLLYTEPVLLLTLSAELHLYKNHEGLQACLSILVLF